MTTALASAHRHHQKLIAAAADISLHDLAAHAGIFGALATCLKAEQIQFMAALDGSRAGASPADGGDQIVELEESGLAKQSCEYAYAL